MRSDAKEGSSDSSEIKVNYNGIKDNHLTSDLLTLPNSHDATSQRAHAPTSSCTQVMHLKVAQRPNERVCRTYLSAPRPQQTDNNAAANQYSCIVNGHRLI